MGTIEAKFRVLEGNDLKVVKDNQTVSRVTIRGNSGTQKIYIKEKLEDSFSDNPIWEGTTSAVDMILTADSNNSTKAKFRVLEGNDLKVVKDNQTVSRVTIRGNSGTQKIYIKEKLDDDFDNAIWEGTTSAVDMIPSIVGGPEPDLGKILPLNADGTVTLPGGQTVKVKNDRLVESIYGNQIIRSMDEGRKKGGTFEATALGKRANGVVQGYIVLPAGIVGMKDDGSDEGTIILKDNHGPGGDENEQYKVWFEYERGGTVKGIILGREHDHPHTEEIEKVRYENQPHLEPGDKLEYKASYQDTKDEGVRLRMDYRDPKTGKWTRLFDHVDYGDGKNGRPYRGRSGVQDGTRVDGRVGGGKPSEDDAEKYKRIAKGKPIGTTNVTEIENILSKLATSAISAREIEPDNSDLRDGKDDPLSFGPKGD